MTNHSRRQRASSESSSPWQALWTSIRSTMWSQPSGSGSSSGDGPSSGSLQRIRTSPPHGALMPSSRTRSIEVYPSSRSLVIPLPTNETG